jgi:hypothetical protein
MPSGEGKAIILLSVFALALVAAGAARADDAIKAGKWEYTAQVQMPNMPNMPKLPPGVQLPPNLQMGPNGIRSPTPAASARTRPRRMAVRPARTTANAPATNGSATAARCAGR